MGAPPSISAGTTRARFRSLIPQLSEPLWKPPGGGYRTERMRNGPIHVLCALAAVGCAAADNPRARPVEPGIELRREERRYGVDGSTAEDLLQSLRARGPRESSRSYFGYTSWKMSWDGRAIATGDGCSLARVLVSVHLVTTLPSWEPHGTVTPALTARWERFFAALSAHERQHDRLVIDGAHELLDRLRSLQTASCATIRREAEAIQQAVVGAVHTRNRAYDERTRHGFSQGASWPPR